MITLLALSILASDPPTLAEILATTDGVATVEVMGDLDGLPGPVVTDGGTLLPSPLDQAVAERLAHYWEMPVACEVKLGALRDFEARKLNAALALTRAEHDLEAADRWAWWEVALVGVGAGAVGTVIGLVVGGVAF